MTNKVTTNFKTFIANEFYNSLDISANSYLPSGRDKYFYVFLGKQMPWNTGTEAVPATISEDLESINSLYRYGILAKQVSLENASFVVPRVNWTSGQTYKEYTANTNFYVLTSTDQVFKCLSNVAVGTASTVEPEVSLSSTSLEEPYLQTSDGYKWKYLYTLTSTQKQKFLSADWMPVTYNKFVRAAAVGGSIDVVKITNSGNNYTDGSSQQIITITGDGTGAVIKANVVGGHIQNAIIQSRGQNYTYATLTVSDITGGSGTSGTATAYISPFDGHGYDPIYELGATTIMFNVEFEGTETGIFPVDNEFRQITLVQNPKSSSTLSLATASKYTLYTRIKTSPGAGDFVHDEKVYQGLTYEDSSFSADVISFDRVQNYLYLNNVVGTLQTNVAIKGFSSGAIRVVNSIQAPSLDLYSGKVLYISDKLPISRDSAQTERIRFILSF